MKDAPSRLSQWMYDRETLNSDPVFVAEKMVLELVDDIVCQMKRLGLRSKDLAARLGVSESAVSQLLSGNQNITLFRIVTVAIALEANIERPRITPRAECQATPGATLTMPSVGSARVAEEPVSTLG